MENLKKKKNLRLSMTEFLVVKFQSAFTIISLHKTPRGNTPETKIMYSKYKYISLFIHKYCYCYNSQNI